MDRFLLCFALGAVSSLMWPLLPSCWLGWGLVLLALLALWRQRWGWGGAGLGLGWCLLFFHWQLAWLTQLGLTPSGQPVVQHTITGQVTALSVKPPMTYLVLQLTSLNGRALTPQPLVRVSWYGKQKVPGLGSEVAGKIRLKPAHGLANPGGFVLERWLLGAGISATGSVSSLQLVRAPTELPWRERWLQEAKNALQPLAQGPLILAMVYGEQQWVPAEQWQLLRDGGIIHLIAVSGMHIGLAAWLGFWLGRLITLMPGLSRWRTGFPLLLSLALATFYTLLSGFALPAQRALFMLAVWLLLRALQCHWSAWRVWWLCWVLLVAYQPWCLFSSSFWLSFVAIGLLWLTTLLWRKPNLLQIQLVMVVGLLPWQLLWFGGVSLLAIPINLLAIPLFCLLLIPIGLLGGLLLPLAPALAQGCFYGCNLLLQWSLSAMQWLFTQVNGWLWLDDTTLYLLSLSWLALLTLWLPGRRPLLWLLGWGALLGCWQPAPLWEVLVIDVGQGLCVLVRQQDRGMLFDTGNAVPGGVNLAEAAILPLLRREGIKQLDYLLVSHKDRDHSGNWQALYQALPVRQLISSAPLSAVTTRCRRGQHWQWQALDLRLLWPLDPRQGEENQDSCVLRVSDGRHTLLLTGDMPAAQEAELLRRSAEDLQADWLLSGHHGSRHSSSAPFVAAVGAKEVIHSSGYANRWGFPHAEVVQRFAGSRQWNTAEAGLIRIQIWPERSEIGAYRTSQPWYRDLDAWLGQAEPLE